jgi:hypothetical protein
MANLTKELKKLAKQKIDPIHEELLEQFESAQFFRQMSLHRENQIRKENKKLIPHII